MILQKRSLEKWCSASRWVGLLSLLVEKKVSLVRIYESDSDALLECLESSFRICFPFLQPMRIQKCIERSWRHVENFEDLLIHLSFERDWELLTKWIIKKLDFKWIGLEFLNSLVKTECFYHKIQKCYNFQRCRSFHGYCCEIATKTMTYSHALGAAINEISIKTD